MGTRKYVITKILQAFLTLVFILAFNFFLFRVMPGNPAALLLRGSSAYNPDNVGSGHCGSRAGQAAVLSSS